MSKELSIKINKREILKDMQQELAEDLQMKIKQDLKIKMVKLRQTQLVAEQLKKEIDEIMSGTKIYNEKDILDEIQKYGNNL